ncbi:hypothetical protein R3P38DRAFT_3367130 [Favolaschia claudopus]|uniref:Origin recognition complex subunit 6 n=1 Tax=Favolaschia claudopus TaxID=2862362 RepID=A0AAW0AA32_9AGAR
MSLDTQTIERLTSDKKTIIEAKRILQRALARTGAGSGHDLGESRTGLASVCAYLASQNLNNTSVTFEAAHSASCQTKPKFKKLHESVIKALQAPKPARRKPASFEELISQYSSRVSLAALPFMKDVEIKVLVKLDIEKNATVTDDELTCAVFMWVCNIIEKRNNFHSKTFLESHETNTKRMRHLKVDMDRLCGTDIEKFRAKYNKAISKSPRKSPTKPVRTLPSRDPSPQKRKATLLDEQEADVSESPTKKRKVGQPSDGFVTLESIRASNNSSSPTKPPATPRKAPRSPASPSKSSPTKVATVGRARVYDEAMLSSDEEDPEPRPRRRFRAVFQDQRQWILCDPRLAMLTANAAALKKQMVQRHGLPFQAVRQGLNVPMDEDS